MDCFTSSLPISVFTDGARDSEVVTVGACLFEHGCPPETFWGEVVPCDVERRWRLGRSWQVIAQSELAPVVLSAHLWRDRLKGKHVLFWLDQDAARQGLIKGYSSNEMSADLIDEALMLLATLGIFPWFSRVPSDSNPADLPSRFRWEELFRLFPSMTRTRLTEEAWAYAK